MPFAAKQNDLIQAVDIHIIMIPTPGGPVPTPLPHPFLGQLNGSLSPDVKIDGQPAATVNSTATNMPSHIPPGGPFQKPPTNQGKVFMGSATVLINGKPAARMGDICMTCNDPSDLPVGKIIVPFSSVQIGGPPSVAGSGASGSSASGGGATAGASSGDASGSGGMGVDPGSGAGGGDADSSEPEDTFVEFEVLDRVGTALTDLKYELILPDGEVTKGTLDGSGKARKDGITPGQATLLLEGLHQARWASQMACVGDEVEMSVRGVALPEGGNVDFEVYREGYEGEPLATLQGTLSGGIARATYTYEYDEAHEGSTPLLVFHAKSGSYFARSSELTMGDRLRGRFERRDGANARIVHYTLKLSDGCERHGVSDNDGRFREEVLPLGKIVIKPRFGGWIEQA